MELPLLGDLETTVLEHLWAQGAAEARDVHRDICLPRAITLSTIQSTLERLHRKKLILRERVGHAYRYAPALTRAAFRARAMAEAAGDLRGADGSGVLAAFVDLVARSGHRHLDELASLIDAARHTPKPPRRR